jgi:Ca-activated chloride channel family protein
MGAASLTFLWPKLLWLLLLVPLAAGLYVAVVWRRRAAAARFTHLELAVGAGRRPLAGGEGAAWRQAVPALLWLAALVALLAAVARPQAALTLPARLDTVVLALDISGSMRATDIQPSRIVAAKEAARAFVEAQPRHVKVGVVAIASAAAVVQSPTTEREDLLRAIDRLQPQRGTALGSGLIIALDAALPQARIDVEQFINPRRPSDGSPHAARPVAPPAPDDAPRDRTLGQSAAIVLLSDGVSNVGPDPLKAAAIAADYGVRVHTVGMGTPEGAIVEADGWSARVRLDEETLKKVAEATHGEYFRATDAAELKRVYRGLSTRLSFERQRPTEITALFAAAGALLASVAALLSMVWFNRIL